MKYPVAQNAAVIGLFGIKAEDMQDALFAMDPTTAVASLGKVAGANGLNGLSDTKLPRASHGAAVRSDAVQDLELITKDELAALFRVPKSWVDEQVSARTIPFTRLGARQIWFSRADIAAIHRMGHEPPRTERQVTAVAATATRR
ncbi:helix-turn-helix transcriptional regulator [Paractinoplanes maris]|uniref:helix-turn-helix transcriptional regulator n=1 Tax=Paractinoplanes maris TaxID=1734446 RepID=UPI002020387F|nr:hypothetical protein [Actinoplanes maris]